MEAAADVIAHAPRSPSPPGWLPRCAGRCRRLRAPTPSAGRAARPAAAGNFGAPPNPPWRASKADANCCTPAGERIDAGHGGRHGTACGSGSGAARRAPPRGRRLQAAQPLEQRVGRLLQQLAPTGRPARWQPPAAHRGTPPSPSASPAGNRCRRRRASDGASATRSSASRPSRSSPARTPCRRRGVDVGTLLPVHLDRHEVLVQQRGRCRHARTTRAP